jgi:hypothetical protein
MDLKMSTDILGGLPLQPRLEAQRSGGALPDWWSLTDGRESAACDYNRDDLKSASIPALAAAAATR